MVSFSGGKDSMLALHRLDHDPKYKIEYLLITMSGEYERSSIHGIRDELVDLQAKALGFPIKKVYLPKNCTNEQYEKAMNDVMFEAERDGITHVAFGDINLKDIREYRENNLAKGAIQPIFPVWGESTQSLMNEFLKLGYQTIITTIDPKKVPNEFLGQVINQSLINQLPNDVDPCGENGEFHTFVIDGPLFKVPIPVKVNDRQVEQSFYTYQDLTVNNFGS